MAVQRTPAVLVEPGELPQKDFRLPKLAVVFVVERTHNEPGPIPVVWIVTNGEVMPYDELDGWVGEVNWALFRLWVSVVP